MGVLEFSIEALAGRDRLVVLLSDWADWCGSYRPRLGYPAAAAGLGGAGMCDFESMCEEVDGVMYRSIDAAVDDLPPAQRAALYRHYGLTAVFRFPRNNFQTLLDEAHDALRRALPRRGVEVAW